MATREQRHARYEKRARRLAREQSDRPRKQPDENIRVTKEAVTAAHAAYRRELVEIDRTYQPKIAELLAEYGEKKRKARADYEERVALVKQATILGA